MAVELTHSTMAAWSAGRLIALHICLDNTHHSRHASSEYSTSADLRRPVGHLCLQVFNPHSASFETVTVTVRWAQTEAPGAQQDARGWSAQLGLPVVPKRAAHSELRAIVGKCKISTPQLRGDTMNSDRSLVQVSEPHSQFQQLSNFSTV